MSRLTQFVEEVPLPEMLKVKQKFDNVCLKDIVEALTYQLVSPKISMLVEKNMTIAVAVGSRGIRNIDLITKTVVSFLKAKGANVFIVPAMGSHGGATAEGQIELLGGYGITEEKMGAAIYGDMDVVLFKEIDGMPIFIGKDAAQADGIIVINRIKPHTSFRGKYESGLFKMCAVGLGKQKSAEVTHRTGFGKMAESIEKIGKTIMKSGKILFGVAILENAYDETRNIHVLTPEEIEVQEPNLLTLARSYMPRIQFEEIDTLVVDYIGKNISGPGADPNITGFFATQSASGGLKCNSLAYLDLTEESHGNANGVGVADVITKRLYDKIDFDMTYPNALTSTLSENVKVPLVMANQRDAIRTAIKFSWQTNPQKVRLIRIKNTLELSEIYVSKALVPFVQNTPSLSPIGKIEPMYFSRNGDLF